MAAASFGEKIKTFSGESEKVLVDRGH